jgi:hypothetical protein
MVGLRVEIRRWVDDAQPGWVEFVFIDACGCEWFFVEKVSIVTDENVDANSDYPRPGVLGCEVRDHHGEVFVIDTTMPWGIEATTGETRFEVRQEQLVGLED